VLRVATLLTSALALVLLTACSSDGDAPAATFAPSTTSAPSTASITAAPTLSGSVPSATIMPSATINPSPTLLPATPVPTGQAPLAGHALGPTDAALTIVMYGDFQCVLCVRYAHDLEVLRSRYPDDVRLVWRHLPDQRAHDKAALALQASEAAAAQGQFWPMHDQLFTHQSDWINLPPDAFRPLLSDYAALIRLDVAQFDAALDAGTYAPLIDAALADAAQLEIMGTPILLYNGVPFTGRDDLFGLDEGVRLALLRKRQFAAPPAQTIDPTRTYRATLVTERGEIVIELYPAAAPVAVNNFVFLARSGWYDAVTFHYVVPGYLAQTGDPSDTGRGLPGYTLPDEHANGLAFDRAGRVAMSHPSGVPDSAGSIFFITLGPLEPAAEWNGQYTIFGQVIAGMEVVQALTPRNANDPVNFPDPPPGDRLITVTITES
jgi:cyclophilin family peptidyl-prolyl cis-trans isomerase/protein-disulfide isomerase